MSEEALRKECDELLKRIAECNNDGNWDLIAAGPSGVSSLLPGRSTDFSDASVQELSETAANAIHRRDLDNDGDKDEQFPSQRVNSMRSDR